MTNTLMTDDEMNRMPWTRDLMTHKEFQDWVASRKQAGRTLDIETCEMFRWAAYDVDPYGVRTDLSPVERQLGKNRFLRGPYSRGWVHESDLSLDVYKAMYDRIDREWQAYARAHPEDPHVKYNIKANQQRDLNKVIPFTRPVD